MWQDDYISERDGEYVCWDAEGEFIAIGSDRTEARQIITDYADIIKRKEHERIIQRVNGVSK